MAITTLLIIIGVFLIGMVAMISWFLFVGPRRRTEEILARPPSVDRQIPQFKDVDPNWITYRLLPQSGWKTIWKLQTSDGRAVGRIQIGGFHKGAKRGANPIEINNQEFWVRRNIENLFQHGFVVESPTFSIKLLPDENFGVLNTLKTNFRNLKMQTPAALLTVQADSNDRIVLARNGDKLGVATYRRGMFPGFAALSPDASELEQAVLFYSMLLV